MSAATVYQPPTPHARAIDWRQTFLRRHIEAELPRIDEILSLREAMRRVEDRFRSIGPPVGSEEAFDHWTHGHSGFTPARFFYDRRVDAGLYFDVPVTVQPGSQVAVRFQRSLTALLNARGCRPCVVLRASTGAGKTIAARRAMFDCFYQGIDPARANEPTLAGHLPCWLRLDEHVPTGELLDSGECVEWPIASVAGTRCVEAIGRRLEAGPPLLILCDLNVLPSPVRERFAAAIKEFLLRWRDRGHRFVVAYRSLDARRGQSDPTLAEIGTVAEPCELRPLNREQAADYVRAFWQLESELARDASRATEVAVPGPDPAKIDADVERVERLLDRQSRGGQTLVSTPLLTHFVTLVDVASVASVSDLYLQVVARHIDRDLTGELATRAPRSVVENDGALVRVALARLGLAMRASGSTRYTAGGLVDLLKNPEVHLGSFLPGCPNGGSYWTEACADYYRRRFSGEEIDAVREFSLLRVDAGQIAFLHDSMIDYFAGAVALGEPRGPGLPQPAAWLLEPGVGAVSRGLGADWRAAVSEAWWAGGDDVAISRWERAAAFLCGSLEASEALELALALIERPDATRAWSRLILWVLSGRPIGGDADLDRLAEAFLVRRCDLIARPDLMQAILRDQIAGDLPPTPSDETRS